MSGVGCDGDASENGATPSNCGLPSPKANVDETLVPDLFLPEGAVLTRAQRERGGFLAAINVTFGVQDALRHYRRAVNDEGYEIIQQDNEGFEAELYLRKGKFLAAIQIRTSKCDDESIVFVNVVDAARLQGALPSPSPKRS